MRLLVLCGVLEEGQSLNGSEGLVCAVGGNKKTKGLFSLLFNLFV
jgi:hypothetical protein